MTTKQDEYTTTETNHSASIIGRLRAASGRCNFPGTRFLSHAGWRRADVTTRPPRTADVVATAARVSFAANPHAIHVVPWRF